MSNRKQEIINALESATMDIGQYHMVYCDHCEWCEYCWLGREAEIRGCVHEDTHDHETWIQAVALMDQNVPGLGFKDE